MIATQLQYVIIDEASIFKCTSLGLIYGYVVHRLVITIIINQVLRIIKTHDSESRGQEEAAIRDE